MSEVDRFLEGLRRQQEKYRQMVAAVEEQQKLLEAPNVDDLMRLAERKRVLMGEIEALERELAPTKERWSEVRAGLDAGAIREVERAVEETRRVLETIVRLEDEGRSLLQKRRETGAEELKDMMKQKRARGAYGGSGSGDARFFDGAR